MDQPAPMMIPPRLKWTKRLGKWMLALILLLAAVRFGWGRHAEARFQRAVEECRRPGIPFFPDEFKGPAVPDDQNAAHILVTAAAITRVPGFDKVDNADYFGIFSPPADVAVVRKQVQANPRALAGLRKARGLRADWGIDMGQGYNLLFQNLPLNGQRQLADLARYASTLSRLDGDDLAAFEYCLDMLDQAKAQGQMPFLVATLVGQGIEAMAEAQLILLAWDLKVGGDKGVSREELQALIARLLDEKDITDTMIRALASERHVSTDALLAIADRRMSLLNPGWPPATSPDPMRSTIQWCIGPAFRTQAARNIRYHTQSIEAAQAPDYPTALKLLPRDHDLSTRTSMTLADAVDRIDSVLRMSHQRVLLVNYRLRAQRRAAAMALAIRLYRLDHGGSLPSAAGELVPRYLPAVPIDPFDPARQPLRMVTATTRPIIYSVKENGIDDVARGAPLPKDDTEAWRHPDYIFDLVPQSPAPPEPEPEPEPLPEVKPLAPGN